MSDHKQFMREFYSPIQYRRLVNLMKALNNLIWWKK